MHKRTTILNFQRSTKSSWHFVIVTACIVGFSVSGCSSKTEPQSAPSSSEISSSIASSSLDPVTSTSSGTTQSATLPGTAVPEPSPTPEKRPQPVMTNPQTGKKNKLDHNGNIIKELGEMGSVIQKDAVKPHMTLTVKSVKVMDSCSGLGDGAQVKPKHKYFLAVKIRSELTKEADKVAGVKDTSMDTSPYSFKIEPAGSTKSIEQGTAEAMSCDYQPVAAIGVISGSVNEGYIVLDSPTKNGRIIYDNEGYGGWAWNF